MPIIFALSDNREWPKGDARRLPNVEGLCPGGFVLAKIEIMSGYSIREN